MLSWVYHQYNNGRHDNESQDAQRKHHQVDVLWMCKRYGRINKGNKLALDLPTFICEVCLTERNKH